MLYNAHLRYVEHFCDFCITWIIFNRCFDLVICNDFRDARMFFVFPLLDLVKYLLSAIASSLSLADIFFADCTVYFFFFFLAGRNNRASNYENASHFSHFFKFNKKHCLFWNLSILFSYFKKWNVWLKWKAFIKMGYNGV